MMVSPVVFPLGLCAKKSGHALGNDQ